MRNEVRLIDAVRPAIAGQNSLAGKPQVRTPLKSPIEDWLQRLHARYQNNKLGKLASYIPELTKADPDHFGVVLTAADGQSYAVGEADALFTIQSISKPLVYGLALEDHGTDGVLRRVGVEPTGEAFNSIVMDELNRLFNSSMTIELKASPVGSPPTRRKYRGLRGRVRKQGFSISTVL